MVITTGGTIASVPQENGDVVASLSGEQLLSRLGSVRDVTVRTFSTVGSFAFEYTTLFDLASLVRAALADPQIDGIVITHGTDTLEETAFFLSMVTERTKPVVLTGAQLDASHPASDGIQNLNDAITIARCPESAAWGPVVVFASFIYTAREVQKVDTFGLEAFRSTNWGPVGRVDKERVIVGRYVREHPLLPLAIPKPVALIRLGVGMTGDEIGKMCNGYPGVVLQAFGRGNAHPSVASKVKELVEQGIPVILTSRCVQGTVAPIYGGGGGRDLVRAGAWLGGDLAGEKARLLLGLLLANDIPWDEAHEYVSKWAHP